MPALVAFLSRHAGLKTPEIVRQAPIPVQTKCHLSCPPHLLLVQHNLQDMSKTVGDFKQRLPKSAEGVPTLTPETFARATKFGFAFIKAFAPWCGKRASCQRFCCKRICTSKLTRPGRLTIFCSSFDQDTANTWRRRGASWRHGSKTLSRCWWPRWTVRSTQHCAKSRASAAIPP